MKTSPHNLTKAAVLSIIVLAALTSCTFLRNPENTLGDISRFLSAVAEADDVFVYEGLPPQSSELYAAEAQRTDLVWFEGYPFYAKALDVSAEEKRKLTVIALEKKNHLSMPPASGGDDVIHLTSFCHEYHPDYAVIWRKGKRKSGSLICFGCGAWKNFTPQGRLYEDLERKTYDELHAILAKYVVQRPKPASNQSGRSN
ncbi:MAG: hypothetical protein ABIO94_09020 [Opitutaceae bacterium]